MLLRVPTSWTSICLASATHATHILGLCNWEFLYQLASLVWSLAPVTSGSSHNVFQTLVLVGILSPWSTLLVHSHATFFFSFDRAQDDLS